MDAKKKGEGRMDFFAISKATTNERHLNKYFRVREKF